MQELTVIGVENGALLAASESGERYRIAIDDVLQSRLRQSIAPQSTGKKLSPREIQGHIRAGLSAEEVARLTGASVDYVERFEGPVLAERAYVVNSALKVAVQTESPVDPLNEEPTSTFGEAIDERLEGLAARDIRWASWKEETGWIVKLSFTANEIDHDARWQYDPKRHALSPLNGEAVTLSQHGELTEGLIPRLRAVATRVDDSPTAFTTGPSTGPSAVPNDTAPGLEPVLYGRSTSKEVSSPAATAAAIKRAEEPPRTDDSQNQTADLLEALRRRRGEREAASFVDDFAGPEESRQPEPVHPVADEPLRPTLTSAAWAVRDTPLDGLEQPSQDGSAPTDAQSQAQSPAPQNQQPQAQKATKRTRASMPSWDEIVFGARTDDDLA
jgi:hypothetical protein